MARFPDSVTSRGAKHLETLMRLKAHGADAAMLYVVQRGDAASMGPAKDIDPTYAKLFHQARAVGWIWWRCGPRLAPPAYAWNAACPWPNRPRSLAGIS